MTLVQFTSPLLVVATTLIIGRSQAAEEYHAKEPPRVIVGPKPATEYHTLAADTISDLLANFWVGSAESGHIVPTWWGYPEPPGGLPDARGALWERATLFFNMYTYWKCTSDDTIRQRLSAEWNHTKSLYTINELEECGASSAANWASDDAGWTAMCFLYAYDVTGDAYALDRAKGVVRTAFSRWKDTQLGGGVWYSDARKRKALYQAALVLSALRIYRTTKDNYFHMQAMDCYNWMEDHLLRADGLYWCEYDASGPIGKERPQDIREADSVSFLGGCMGMGVIHAELYRMTGDYIYRGRAIRTAEGLTHYHIDANGVYIDDRDAWTNGAFAGDWARLVLTLPGMNEKHRNYLRGTASAIHEHDRTPDGYFGGSWGGPVDESSTWYRNGSKPKQIMTSSAAASMIIAAACLPPSRLPSANGLGLMALVVPLAGAAVRQLR